MAVNKVVYGNDTLIDLTEDTVQPEDVAMGETFHDRSGALRTGTSSGTGGVPIELLKDTVGWTGKNLFKPVSSPSSVNISSIAYDDGSVVFSGYSNGTTRTPNIGTITLKKGKYILSGVSGGSPSTYGLRLSVHGGSVIITMYSGEEEFEVTTDDTVYDVIGRFDASQTAEYNVTMYPMIRYASISDSTFEPYHEDVDTCKYNRSEANILGAKNLYKPVPAGTKTVENIDWIINADGTVEADGTCSSGTASKLQITERYGRSGEKQFFPNGKYIINGNPDDSTTFLQVGVTKSGAYASLAQGVGDVAFEIDGDDSSNYGAYVQIVCGVTRNTTVSHVLFKPMIRLASDPDDTYVPYAMTNKELTDAKAEESALAPIENGITASQGYNQGSPFMRFGKWCIAKTAIASGETLTEGTNYEVKTVADSLQNIVTTATIGDGASSIGVTLNSNATNKTIIRYGNVVNFRVRINIADAITLSGDKRVVELGYVPALGVPKISASYISAPYELITSFQGVIDSSGRIVIKSGTALTAGEIDFSGTYICQ